MISGIKRFEFWFGNPFCGIKKLLITFCICFLLGLGIFAGTSCLVSADTTESYQDEIDAAKARKEQLEKQVQTIKAPIEGYVNELEIHTVGGVVTPAQALMTIVSK